MADERDEIRARVNIVELVGREVPIKQKGKHWTGLCPFHADKNPSFTVSPDTGRYRCWSCGETGDIFTWVMKRRNVDFVEALDILAKEAGIEIKRGGGMPPTVRQTYQEAMDEALAFFREQFAKSSVVQDYCARRGLDPETLETWEMGYAPDVSEALPTHLRRKGISLSEAKNLFLVDGDQDTGYYAKFRGRLMFPIRDEKGALVAFGGRLLGDGQPKYINSSDTPIYRKSRVLYGMYRAREAIRQSRRAVLVEGYLDVIACHRAGVTSAIASLGTSLTEDHAKLLKRWCEEVVILYDSDEAGQRAAGRAVEILEAEQLRVRVALMPPGDDPDTLLRKEGAAAVQRSVEGGVLPSEYGLRSLEKKRGPQEPEFWDEASSILADESNAIELTRHIDRLAGVFPGTRDLDLAKKAIQGMIAKAKRSKKKGAEPNARPGVGFEPRAIRGELTSAEVVIFCAFLSDEFRRQAWSFAQMTDLFASGMGRDLSLAIKAAYPIPPQGKPAEWLPRLGDSELESFLADLAFDPRGARLTAEFIADSVDVLRKKMARRQRLGKWEAESDIAQFDAMVRQMKVDTRQKADTDDDLF